MAVERVERAHGDGDPEGLGAGPDGQRSSGVAGVGDEEGLARRVVAARDGGHIAIASAAAVASSSSEGAGEREAREVAHHRLEVEERLQPALRDLRLVGVYCVYWPGS